MTHFMDEGMIFALIQLAESPRIASYNNYEIRMLLTINRCTQFATWMIVKNSIPTNSLSRS